MNKGIIISAEKLKKNNPKKKIISEIINTISYKLNSAIDQAYKNNESEICYNLPISFNIPNTINHKNFQLEVYCTLIDLLDSKGYNVGIKLLKNETILKVNWSYESNNNLEDMKNKLISKIF